MNTEAASPVGARLRDVREGFRLCLLRTDLSVLMVSVKDGARDDAGEVLGKEKTDWSDGATGRAGAGIGGGSLGGMGDKGD